MMPLLKAAKQSFEHSTALKHEAEALRLIMLEGSAWRAWKAADAAGVHAGVITILKAAAAAITTGSGTDVVAGPNVWPAFTGTLRTASVFDAIAAEAMPVPFWTKVGMMSSQLSGSKVAEGASKPGQVAAFTQGTLTPEKFVSLVAVTKEFLESGPGVLESLTMLLQRAVGGAADLEFLTDAAATNSEASTGEGPTMQGITNDIFLILLPMLDYSQASSLFLVVAPDHARAMTIAGMSNGINTMGPMGGSFGGLRVLVSDSSPSNSIVLIDATGIAVAQTPVMFKASGEATISLDTAPTGASGPSVTATSLTSMLQTNSVALLCERSLAFAPIRPNPTATLTNITWGVSAESPLP